MITGHQISTQAGISLPCLCLQIKKDSKEEENKKLKRALKSLVVDAAATSGIRVRL
jgi:hypothetical protein